MIIRHGFFHADPHPGNLMALPGPKLAIVDFGQAKELPDDFREVFIRFTRALLSDDNKTMGIAFRDLGFRTQKDTAEGYEQLGDAYIGRIARQMNETGAGWAEGSDFEESYQDIMKILRNNRLTAVPSELLLVGRVTGLLNGLSKTLQARTNMLVSFMQVIDEEERMKAGLDGVDAGDGVAAAAPRRLLEA
jgi:predicted unusual protein kinase regulating ubiquinone biosynthesis (AarF/ABC1/UbiB family)